jgi:hypothetical protein
MKLATTLALALALAWRSSSCLILSCKAELHTIPRTDHACALKRRYEYLRTCFWSLYEYFPHIVAGVTRQEDVDWCM